MLQLQNVYKQYRTGDIVQLALNNVSINLRDNEFVSILGPSGSGKTTLLNIIGGLDHYDAGDLIINGVSTRGYQDRDWDSYRNHTIGFVFQSYNLIPHQTVLANVELALKISGVPASERRQRTTQALMDVGLGDHLNKRPSQLSGGQMQRVAIARALVNNPAILLADEPTGALDSDTSIQVMELLRNVAKSRLVVMVTHNDELAREYSTRIISLRDGKITGDTRPLLPPRQQGQMQPSQGRPPKVGMGFGSSLSLSLRNLMTKKGRTALTSFAGSIGIIGIALIIAMSSSVNNYVENLQRDTMLSYPITIQSQSFSMGKLLSAAMNAETEDDKTGNQATPTDVRANYEILKAQAQATLAIKTNDLASFKAYLESPDNPISEHVGKNGISYTYDIPFDVYATDADGKIIEVSKVPKAKSDGGPKDVAVDAMTDAEGESSQTFSEIPFPDGGTQPSDAVQGNYEVIHGRWPEKSDEMVLVTGADGTISATFARQIGLLTQSQYNEVSQTVKDGGVPNLEPWSYEQICSVKLMLVSKSDQYMQDANGRFRDIDTKDEMTLRNLLGTRSTKISIVGVARPKSDNDTMLISAPLAYPPAVTDALVERASASAAVIAQEANPAVSVLSGMPFGVTDDTGKAEAVKAHLLGLTQDEKASAYMMLSYTHPEAFQVLQPTVDAASALGGMPMGGPTSVDTMSLPSGQDAL